MLGYSEVNIKVSDNSTKTIGIGEYKELLKIDEVTNKILAIK